MNKADAEKLHLELTKKLHDQVKDDSKTAVFMISDMGSSVFSSMSSTNLETIKDLAELFLANLELMLRHSKKNIGSQFTSDLARTMIGICVSFVLDPGVVRKETNQNDLN